MRISAKLSAILFEIRDYSTSSIQIKLINKLFDSSGKSDYLDYVILNKDVNTFSFTALPTNITVPAGTNPYDIESRGKISLGKVLNTIAPDFDENIKRALIEQIISKIKSSIGMYKLEVVSGEAIRQAYHPDNYATSGSGTNINSCMAHAMYQLNIDFYVYNPEVIRMLRAVTSTGKIAGRALIYTAYRTIEDLMEGRNARILLGRYYIASTSINALFDGWALSNVDFKINSQTVTNFKGESHNNWQWYIPLKHWDLNYYPYMDHFNYVYKNIVDGYGVWSTDASYNTSHKWIQPGKDSYKDSESKYDSKLDPFRPGKVFLKSSREWVDETGLTKIKGEWIKKEYAVMCDICQEFELKTKLRTLHDLKKACRDHELHTLVDGNYALKSDVSKCIGCQYYVLSAELKDQICKRCVDKMKTCPLCNIKVDRNFFFTIYDGTEICAQCADTGKYSRCDDCFLIKQGVKHLNDQWLCTACHKSVVDKQANLKLTVDINTTTAEQYVNGSTDLAISPNAMRIILQSSTVDVN